MVCVLGVCVPGVTGVSGFCGDVIQLVIKRRDTIVIKVAHFVVHFAERMAVLFVKMFI